LANYILAHNLQTECRKVDPLWAIECARLPLKYWHWKVAVSTERSPEIQAKPLCTER